MVGAASFFQDSGSAQRPPRRSGQRVYCRREAPLGSRFASKKNCGTVEELKLHEEPTKASVQQSQRQGQ